MSAPSVPQQEPAVPLRKQGSAAPTRGRLAGHPVREICRERDFRRLISVRLAGQLGDGLLQGALVGAAFFNPEKATSAGEAALAFAVLLLPYSLVGPFAGVLLDRWSRQRVLLVANLVRSGLVALLALALLHFGATGGLTLALALVVISVNRFVLSGLSASLPQVVAQHRLVTANSFTTTLGGGAAALGGGLAFALRALLGSADSGAARIALIAGLGYVVAALLARPIPVRRLGPLGPPPHDQLVEAARAVLRGLREGAQHVRARGPAARALAAITAHRFFYGLSFIATLLLYTETGALHRGLGGLGQVIAASVVGGLLAALVTPGITRRTGTQRWIVAVFALAAVVEIAFGLPYTHAAFLVAALGLGFAAQAAKICVDTLLQESVEDAYRGRVFSLYDTLFNVSFVSAAGLAALIVPSNGKSYAALGVIAGGYALTSVVYAAANARRADHEPPEPVLSRGTAARQLSR